MNEIEILTKLNHSIRDAEWNRDVQFMQKLLDEDLLFRRANGTIADKKTYLDGLADLNNTYDHLENVDVKVNINENENLATATVIVKASGKRGKEQIPFNGEFKNTRFFRKKEEWKLNTWYNETFTYRHWNEVVAFDVWKHHAGIGGADKDRMIKIGIWLLGFSVAIVSFESNKIAEPLAMLFLSIAGLITSCISGSITLLYGGYANWNWAKADQIAKDYEWNRLYPSDSPFPKSKDKTEKRSFLVSLALQQAEPRPPHKKLAPIFWWFFGMSVISFVVHLSILIWSIASL